MNKNHGIPECGKHALSRRRFYDCTINEKLLYTAFILLMGLGYLMALTYLYTSFEYIDGKPGLSVEDIAKNYYGNRSGTRLEAAIRGSMSGRISILERNHVVAWLKSGAPEKGYETTIRPILAGRCISCHSPASGLKIPDLSSYDSVLKVARVDTGVSLHSLMKISHIHLFGIGLVALSIGLIFRFTVLPPLLKYTLTLLPFAAIFVDILSWFLTKWDPVYAYTIFISGGALGVAWAGQMLISLYQIWFLRPPNDV